METIIIIEKKMVVKLIMKIKKVWFNIFVNDVQLNKSGNLMLIGEILKPENLSKWNKNIQTNNVTNHIKGNENWTYGNIISQTLKDADLTEAHLPNLNFKGKDLSGVKFNNADLRRSIFSGANICVVDFTDAKLDTSILGGAIYDNRTKGLSEEQKSVMIHKDEFSSISYF